MYFLKKKMFGKKINKQKKYYYFVIFDLKEIGIFWNF